MKISVAQIRPVAGDISGNIEIHEAFIELAASFKTDAIFFPELSLTGFEPMLAQVLAIDASYDFDTLKKLSDDYQITIGVGMPVRSGKGITISMLIYQPRKPRQIYSKQLLHEDEKPYFVEGGQQIVFSVKGRKIAPAICYESLQIEHITQAQALGAAIYVTSVAKSQDGIDRAYRHYSAIANQFAMPVLMSNCIGYCDNFESVGQSGVWAKDGRLIGQLNQDSLGILVYDTETEEVLVGLLA